MKHDFSQYGSVRSLCNGMFVPVVLLISSIISGCFSYSEAQVRITDDLNGAIITLAHENSQLWTSPDTIAALRQMKVTTRTSLIVDASQLKFKNRSLKEEAFYTLTLVEDGTAFPKVKSGLLASDSIMLMPECSTEDVAVRVQGFADCSMASVLAFCDPTLPGILFALSLLSMGYIAIRRRKRLEEAFQAALSTPQAPTLDGIKLTPMQRELMRMLLDAPGMKVAKTTLCSSLWDDKSNAEESLYTLVRRTKVALVNSKIEIICNRGESYELRIKD